MKAILWIIGLVLCLPGKAREKSSELDSVFLNSDDVLFSNSYFNKSIGIFGSRIYEDSKQKQNYHAFLKSGFFVTTNGVVPFWMRSMQFGSVPSDGISVSLIGGAIKDYKTGSERRLLDWGVGFEGRLNAGNQSEFILVEAYAKVRFSIFEFIGGRFREQIGIVDSTLSSGSFSLSGNALGVPKIEVGIADYWNLPLTNGLVSIKGNLAHGWMAKQILNESSSFPPLVSEIDAYLHQLSVYGRIGKTNWKVKFYGGANHMVTWGHENEIFPDWGLSQLETFKYVLTGKAYGTSTVPKSKIGNHIGTIDQGMEWETNGIMLAGYHQFFYDVGALAKFANVKDGLWGLRIKNQKDKSTGFYWKKFLFEYLHSKSQGGEIDSKPRPSGAENYYNNFLYYDGWSYNGDNLGNSLFTSKKYIKDGYPTTPYQYFPNNRVIAFHGGAEFIVNGWYCKGLLTFSRNYGAYSTSRAERRPPDVVLYHDPPYFPKLNQFSAYLESHRELRNGFELGIQLAIDRGELLYNSFGGGISLTKRW